MFNNNPLWNYSISLIIKITIIAVPFTAYYFGFYALIFFTAGVFLGIVSFAGIIKLAYIIIPEPGAANPPEIEKTAVVNNNPDTRPENDIKNKLKAPGPDFFDKVKLFLLYLAKLALFVFFFWQAARAGIYAILSFMAGFSVIIPALLFAGMCLKSSKNNNY